jgi:ankyrin repeat protein
MAQLNKSKNNNNKNQYEIPYKSSLEILDTTDTNNIIVNEFLSKDYEGIKKMVINGFKDIDTKNQFGHTALHIACLSERYDRVKLLIECGANLNVKDNRGNTPIYAAIKKGNVEIVKLLLKCEKINLEVKNIDGLTPLEYAKEITEDETPLLWERKNKLAEIMGLLKQ